MKPYTTARRRIDGFSLVEVMVALVVISVGMLGIAKMQALALASTGTAKMRSLAAIEAASLASTLHANRAYWGAITKNLTVTVSAAGAVTGNPDTSLNTAPSNACNVTTAPFCTPAQMAAQDLSDWATSVKAILPKATSTITCNIDTTNQNPVTCNIQLQWTENVVASDTGRNASATMSQNQSALQSASFTQTTYTLYVQP